MCHLSQHSGLKLKISLQNIPCRTGSSNISNLWQGKIWQNVTRCNYCSGHIRPTCLNQMLLIEIYITGSIFLRLNFMPEFNNSSQNFLDTACSWLSPHNWTSIFCSACIYIVACATCNHSSPCFHRNICKSFRWTRWKIILSHHCTHQSGVANIQLNGWKSRIVCFAKMWKPLRQHVSFFED